MPYIFSLSLSGKSLLFSILPIYLPRLYGIHYFMPLLTNSDIRMIQKEAPTQAMLGQMIHWQELLVLK